MSSSVVGAAAVVDTSNVLYPTRGILLCLKKVKGKDTDPAIGAQRFLHVSGSFPDFWQ